MQRLNACGPTLVRSWIDVRYTLRDYVHIRVGLLHGRAGFEPAHHRNPTAVVPDLIGFEGKWDHQMRFKAVSHSRSEHADHRVGLAVQPDLLAEYVGVRTQTLPQPV